jgi:hypothetical protein
MPDVPLITLRSMHTHEPHGLAVASHTARKKEKEDVKRECRRAESRVAKSKSARAAGHTHE